MSIMALNTITLLIMVGMKGSTWHIFTTISPGSFYAIYEDNQRKGLTVLIKTGNYRCVWSGLHQTKSSVSTMVFLGIMTSVSKTAHRGLQVQNRAHAPSPAPAEMLEGGTLPQQGSWNVATGLFLDWVVAQFLF